MPDLKDQSGFSANPPARQEELAVAESDLGLHLPEQYKIFLKYMNGGEGFVGEHFVILWRVSELAPFNADYETAEYAPGILFIGSNGGGEGLAFDMECDPWRIVLIPFIGMERKVALDFGNCFNDFLDKLTSDFDPFSGSNK